MPDTAIRDGGRRIHYVLFAEDPEMGYSLEKN